MKKNNTSIGIFGYGEVGKALATFYNHPKIKDRTRDDGLTNLAILHICISYGPAFVKTVKAIIKKSRPNVTIIHSTVAVGTTKKIGGMVVHSPVRGVHPNLAKGIKTFIKYIGADNKIAALRAQKHLKSIGLKTQIFYPSKTTELAKLLDTTYYGLCIAYHGEMKRICDKHGVNFEDAVTDFNQSYNIGYTKLDMSHVVRPVLTPPISGIGGHCVLPNVDILQKQFKSLAFNLILRYKSKKK